MVQQDLYSIPAETTDKKKQKGGGIKSGIAEYLEDSPSILSAFQLIVVGRHAESEMKEMRARWI